MNWDLVLALCQKTNHVTCNEPLWICRCESNCLIFFYESWFKGFPNRPNVNIIRCFELWFINFSNRKTHLLNASSPFFFSNGRLPTTKCRTFSNCLSYLPPLVLKRGRIFRLVYYHVKNRLMKRYTWGLKSDYTLFRRSIFDIHWFYLGRFI